MVGPDALKWSWLLFVFGLLLLADGGFNWAMFGTRRDPTTGQLMKYDTFGRVTRMVAGSFIALMGGLGLAYLAFARLHP
jgi:hypothetical protein